MTVTDLITRGMGDLGLLQEGEVPTPDQLTAGINAINDWIDGLAPDTLTIYAITRTLWTLTAATSYTVGTGGDVNIARPASPQAITNIGYVNNNFSPAVEVQLGPCLTDDAYAAIPIKTYTNPLPTAFYYSATNPLGTLRPWPVPSASLLQGVIYTRTAVTEFTSVTQTVSVPPGYRRYFRTNLALEIAPVFAAQPSPVLIKNAMDSAQAIKTANVRPMDMTSDAARLFHGGAKPNLYTGAE